MVTAKTTYTVELTGEELSRVVGALLASGDPHTKQLGARLRDAQRSANVASRQEIERIVEGRE